MKRKIIKLGLACALPLLSTAQVVNLGTSGNMFTLLNANMHCLSADSASNSVLFIHRSDNSVFTTDNVAMYRYDLSTDGGTTFNLNKGPLNPLANNTTVSCRYPQVLIDNPSKSTTPASVYFQYLGSYHNNSDWDGVSTGTGRMDNLSTTYTANNTQINAGSIGVTTSMCKGAANTFWSVSTSLSSTNTELGDIIVMKGTQSGNNVSWTTSKLLTPNWDKGSDGVTIHMSTPNISFDPTGTYGWIALLGDAFTNPDADRDFVSNPILYKTIDGGLTWKGPYLIDLQTFPLINSVYPDNATFKTVTAAFESDLSVDKAGNPHMFFAVGRGKTLTETTDYSVRASNMFDLSFAKNVNKFTLHFVAPVHQLRAEHVGLTTNTSNVVILNSEDQRPQVSTSPDGSKVYYSWNDNILSNVAGVDTVIQDSFARYLYVKGMNISNGTVSASYNVSQDPTYSSIGNKAYFFTAAPTVKRISGASIIPVAVGVINPIDSKLESVSSFKYLNNIQILDDSIKFVTDIDTNGISVAPEGIVSIMSKEFQPNVAPIPVNNNLTISNIVGNNVSIKIFNIEGKVMFNKELINGIKTESINTSDLSAGVYFFVFNSSNGQYIEKIIKE